VDAYGFALGASQPQRKQNGSPSPMVLNLSRQLMS
jgi:hypothetical protein